MRKSSKYHNDFIVDRLTNSIVNCVSGGSFPTEVLNLTLNDIKSNASLKKWKFNWAKELKAPDREVYKLVITVDHNTIQGLISLIVKADHVYVHLIENAPFNFGKGKLYEGVAGNLMAFACRLSFQRGNEGYVSFLSKTNLIEHYIETLEAIHYGNHLMVVDRRAATKLVEKYFK